MSDREWLDGLKAGDEVIVDTRWHGLRLAQVKRTTATQIVLDDGVKYSRKHGQMVGADTWGRSYIHRPTPGHRATARRNALLGHISMVEWKKQPTDKLERVVASLNESAPAAAFRCSNCGRPMEEHDRSTLVPSCPSAAAQPREPEPGV